MEIKKEGNKMIESMNLIDIYANKQINNIHEETFKKIEELRNNCETISKYEEIRKNYEEQLDNLYLSQFNEEEIKNDVANGLPLDDSKKPLIRNVTNPTRYDINDNFEPDGARELVSQTAQKTDEIREFIKIVKSHVGIAKTKEEVEEILTRYEIIDKKGKLVTK